MREALGALVRPLASHALSKGGASGLAFSAVVVGGLNFVGYSVTALTGTHKITDLVGTGAFVASSILCSWKSHGSFRNMPLRPLAINLAVGVWGVRLASYLFYRILKTGEDDRLKGFFKAEDEAWFDRSKSFFPVNLAGFWIIQSLWAWVVSMPVTMATFSRVHSPLGLGGGLAVASFAAGFAIETGTCTLLM
jgi:steroid 5-alpha reductase family enzyme